MIYNIFLFFQDIVEWDKINWDLYNEGCSPFSIALQAIIV